MNGHTLAPNKFKSFKDKRECLIEKEIVPSGIKDQRVIDALLVVPREKFVSEEYASEAYLNKPLPIGFDQTISQPSLVAKMTEELELTGNEKVLEVGTGSGYQSAILSLLAKEVYTIEIVPQLAKKAKETLKRLGYNNVHVLSGDGTLGLPLHAPYDAIIVTAAAPNIPQPLVEQLAEGGKIVVPIGNLWFDQDLMTAIKKHGKLEIHKIYDVVFVPLKGKYGYNH